MCYFLLYIPGIDCNLFCPENVVTLCIVAYNTTFTLEANTMDPD